MPAPTANTLIDRVDDSDRRIGLVARGSAIREHAGFRVVHILVWNKAGDVLLQRLPQTRERSPGLWGSSVAGYLNAGESYQAAGVRRLKEELDLSTELSAVGVTRMDDEGATKFIGVFTTFAETPRIVDPTHIAEIEFLSPVAIDERLQHSPEQFTETFPVVWTYLQTVTR